ncbi:MAG: hypothetical protein Q7V09_04985 [Hydrogenophaga sp.]|uniref:hypothetical protein n=1 Tax=Hydrogenophaga sp. TaxID=1904254 RepID=UPI0027195114|nr:hypothetical protein [Hydrogenophaga sp.]MDO9029766.1 hypothetical protein [Hydrogenophaga sp.]
MVKIAHLLDTAWADFALDNPRAVERAVVVLREHLATLPEDGHLHGPTGDLVAALESNPVTARAAWAEWVAAEASKVRRKLSGTQATRRTLKKKPTVEDIRKTMYALISEKHYATKPKVSGRLGVSESTIDRVLRDAGTSWIKIKTSYPGKR